MIVLLIFLFKHGREVPVTYDPEINRFNNRGLGRELFQFKRDGANGAEQGATIFDFD